MRATDSPGWGVLGGTAVVVVVGCGVVVAVEIPVVNLSVVNFDVGSWDDEEIPDGVVPGLDVVVVIVVCEVVGFTVTDVVVCEVVEFTVVDVVCVVVDSVNGDVCRGDEVLFISGVAELEATDESDVTEVVLLSSDDFVIAEVSVLFSKRLVEEGSSELISVERPAGLCNSKEEVASKDPFCESVKELTDRSTTKLKINAIPESSKLSCKIWRKKHCKSKEKRTLYNIRLIFYIRIFNLLIINLPLLQYVISKWNSFTV